ncbi:alpha-amylase family glycosyl hydrolase [Telmatobacter sp. DSM 110680]|uniref:Alpha-amylase family glycosyl hydrolase n=1 Tax=Telmatobacter sp. DSM 110680 TaxID=3036704 RepID=A0AAU7DKV9_9BACT
MKSRLSVAFACFLAASFGTGFPVLAQQADPAIASLQARTSPEWLKSGTIYQIFVRSFSPSGDLNGVTGRLDDLHKLGVNILWLMPIHPYGQVKKKGSLGSPYAVRDYYAIDPPLGTKEDLRRLVQEAHKRQMKVIIDMVANHTSWDSVMMAHPDFYKKDKEGHVTYPYDWTDVAALDYSNPKLRHYMTDMLLYWIKNFDLDGYRCDAAGEVPTDFWEQARKELEQAKPDIMMLAEASKPELMRSAFDIDYAWPMLHTVDDIEMNGEPATKVRDTIEQQDALFPKGTLHMRMSDDHDELRAVTRYGFPGAIAASALMFTLNGTPLIYNGMEVGDDTQSRDPALFEPQKIFWSAESWHPEYRKFYESLTALRHDHPALQQGATIWLHNSNEQHVVTYLRRSGSEEFLIAINLSNTPFRGSVEATGNWKEIELPVSKTEPEAVPFISLNAFGARIFQKQAQ